MQSKRQGEVVQCSSEVKFFKIEQLIKAFQASTGTIHQDLLKSERESSIKRVRGDAVYNNLRTQEMEFERKMEKHQMEKQAIVRLASEYANDRGTIAMNSGTTSLALARCLVERKNQLTVIINSSDVTIVLDEDKSSSVCLTSGYLRKHNWSLVDSMSSDTPSNLRVDKAIVNIDEISVRDGVTEYNTEEAVVLKKMLEIGHTRMVLYKLSKSSEMTFNKVCSVEQVGYVFTDWNVSSKEIEAWADVNVEMMAAFQGSVEKSWNCQ